jgi:predicted cupin superfamily sugar epimerase
LNAGLLKTRLGLTPLEGEGGFFVRTHTAGGENPPWSSILYLMTSEEKGSSTWHVLTSDEQWHFYAGDPVELYTADLLRPGFTRYRLGLRIDQGDLLQAVVPMGVVQGARLVPGGEWALLGMTVIPAFTPDSWKKGDTGQLLRLFPEHTGIIKMLAGGES